MQNKVSLRNIQLLREDIFGWKKYPFNIPVIKNLDRLDIKSRVCFFIGENGTGKSTLLEAIAAVYGFGKEGGSKNIGFSTADKDTNDLADHIRLSWSKKLLGGYFFRAESFFNLATYLDDMKNTLGGERAYDSYGGESLHIKSHGQSLLALFNNRFSGEGFYLLDEPEAALSPQRQLSLLIIIRDILKNFPDSQFIIATHSPILLAFPDAQIMTFDGKSIEEIQYEDTAIYQISKAFLASPENFIEKLFVQDSKKNR